MPAKIPKLTLLLICLYLFALWKCLKLIMITHDFSKMTPNNDSSDKLEQYRNKWDRGNETEWGMNKNTNKFRHAYAPIKFYCLSLRCSWKFPCTKLYIGTTFPYQLNRCLVETHKWICTHVTGLWMNTLIYNEEKIKKQPAVR